VTTAVPQCVGSFGFACAQAVVRIIQTGMSAGDSIWNSLDSCLGASEALASLIVPPVQGCGTNPDVSINANDCGTCTTLKESGYRHEDRILKAIDACAVKAPQLTGQCKSACITNWSKLIASRCETALSTYCANVQPTPSRMVGSGPANNNEAPLTLDEMNSSPAGWGIEDSHRIQDRFVTGLPMMDGKPYVPPPGDPLRGTCGGGVSMCVEPFRCNQAEARCDL
jgi:hypothetical protein